MTKYKIFTNEEEYKLQRSTGRNLFGYEKWEWLDKCNAWCNWYGKDNPKIFKTKKEVENFIKAENWKIAQEIII